MNGVIKLRIKVFELAKNEIEKFLERQFQKGLNKYGTPLTTFNARDAFDDGMQEAVDLIMYLNQLKLERNRICEILLYGLEPTPEEKEYIGKYGNIKE